MIIKHSGPEILVDFDRFGLSLYVYPCSTHRLHAVWIGLHTRRRLGSAAVGIA